MSQSCIFCQIAAKNVPSSLVYEDHCTIAFLDIHPVNEGHILVVPKRHVERFASLTAKEASHLFEIGHKLLGAIEKSRVRSEGANLFLSDGEVAGQEVMHSHLHIVPRYAGDGHRMGFVHADRDEAPRTSLDDIASELRRQLIIR